MIINRNKFQCYSFLFVLFYLVISCEQKKAIYLTLIAINEKQDCEEENIFYRILEIDNHEYKLVDSRDSLVLFSFGDTLDNGQNYTTFFPSFTSKRIKVKVYGYFFDSKIPDNHRYGCPGSNHFNITRIDEIIDVTDIDSFSINRM